MQRHGLKQAVTRTPCVKFYVLPKSVNGCGNVRLLRDKKKKKPMSARKLANDRASHQLHDMSISPLKEGKRSRKGLFCVIYAGLTSSFSMLQSNTHTPAHARVHTHSTLRTCSPVVSVELKGQQMTGCTFKMAVRVPSSVNASTRARTETIQEPRQLKGKCVSKSSKVGKHSPEHVATSHGNESRDVQERRGEERVKRSTEEHFKHPRDDD